MTKKPTTTTPAEEVTEGWSGGTGEPIVLLHGINASWRIWRPVLPLLEPHGEIHALTLAGHRGGAPVAPGPVAMAQIADAMEVQLDRLDLPTAHLVGNSLGGWLALELAQRGRARSVTAFSPAGAWRRPKDRKRLLRMFRLVARLAQKAWFQRLMHRPGFMKLALKSACEHPDRIPPGEMPGAIDDLVGCTLVNGFLDAISADDTPVAFTIDPSVPVRIVWPEKDKTIPWANYGIPMVDAVPGAEVVRVTGVGHVPMGDDPDMVARNVVEVVDWATSDSHRSAS